MSAMVYIRDGQHGSIKCRALLDTCATANFISERIIKKLHLSIIPHSVQIGAINAINTVLKGLVQVVIQSTHDDFSKNLTCLTISAVADLIPSEVFSRNTIKIPRNIRLADPDFHLPRAVDLLIGSGATLSLLSIGQINLSHEEHDLYLQKTRLGWVVAGSVAPQFLLKNETCYLTKLESQLNKFWTIEEIATNKLRSKEKNRCETHFLNTVSRDDFGRYTVRLPFRETNKRLGDSRTVALKRLLTLERKFNTNQILKNEYTQIIDEYLKLNYISVVEDVDDDGYYMTHHAVIKESSNTTKLRIVFDASAKTSNNISLNDILMMGPTIQNKLFSHLICFRTYRFVISADIEKMYLQVLLHQDDKRYQRILWRKNNKIRTLQFNTLTFGVSSSPFLAIRVLTN